MSAHPSNSGLAHLLDRRRARPSRIGFERAVGLGQRHLGVDVVYICEVNRAGQACRALAGDGGFGIAVDESLPAVASFGRELADGAIAGCIGDGSEEGRLGELAEALGVPIGSFIGVPLWLADGSLFGALCGLSREPRPNLDERDRRFLAMLGELIVEDLGEQRCTEQVRADLTRLIENEDVGVAYQPIIDLHDGRCIGVEALARFRQPYSRPDLTLQAAETIGLRTELERLIVTRAWPTIEVLGRHQFLALNLAPDSLLALAARANLKPEVPLEQIVVEVTEHTVVDSYATLHHELEPLRRRGLRIAVDDAGAGYSSLRHVLELRPDFIKIDRYLVDGLARDHARRVAVSAFMSLARDLGSVVIAEGVEQQSDLAAVRRLGLHAVQGYLLGRPTTDLDSLAHLLGSKAARGGEQVDRWAGMARHRREPAVSGAGR